MKDDQKKPTDPILRDGEILADIGRGYVIQRAAEPSQPSRVGETITYGPGGRVESVTKRLADGRTVTLGRLPVVTQEAVSQDYLEGDMMTSKGTSPFERACIEASITHVDGVAISPLEFNAKETFKQARDWFRLGAWYRQVHQWDKVSEAAAALKVVKHPKYGDIVELMTLVAKRRVVLRGLDIDQVDEIERAGAYTANQWLVQMDDLIQAAIVKVDGGAKPDGFNARTEFPDAEDWMLLRRAYTMLDKEVDDPADFLIEAPAKGSGGWRSRLSAATSINPSTS